MVHPLVAGCMLSDTEKSSCCHWAEQSLGGLNQRALQQDGNKQWGIICDLLKGIKICTYNLI